MSRKFDYIIVGAGSAGCVLANRLSEDPGTSVLLLEFGGGDGSPFIQMPTALSIPMNSPRYNWGFASEPEPHLDGRRMNCPRGKVLGGTSSINGMVYVRGHACDFDEWESLGADGWSYRDCLPYFRRAETCAYGGDEYRGDGGPLHTCNGNGMANPLYQAFIDAGREAGYPGTDDYNGRQQEGFGRMDMTVRNGVRWSAANAYLKPIRSRTNLTVESGALVRRIVMEDRKAVGVEYDRDNVRRTAHGGGEIILAAGSIGSPHLLQLSGIGPAAVLANAGISPVHDLPGVGANLTDHLEVYFQFQCHQPITLNGKLDPFSKFLIGARWYLFKSGLGGTNHFESCAFIRSRAGLKWPDIQYHFLPAAMRYDGQAAFSGHGFQVHVGPNKPQARGSVAAISPDPLEKPEILFNYLDNEADRDGFRKCIRLTREIIGQPAFDAYRGGEIQPGMDVTGDGEIDAWVRANAESAYHPSCTCKIGGDNDAMAVLDRDCRVRGLEGLRVVDASVFPAIPNGNLNAPTIMVAEKAADLIRGRAPLPPSDAEVQIDPQWQTRQRPGRPVREVA
ncbi:MAG: choline dehydrogenase [Rhodospirillaceae bacterium]|jgi:choline dehydrogenase|nr:choline dehydrogenase [Rhodospirillaceae bacterium]MBT5894848.1 choline dehydrogenase [Rhodospirillaceae bacterium]MBT6431414.1 choline dehydrogenase [Rhodospirillaceae bacterium]MBT7760771.1 choline dehydrogenase [Rhodospirillaceae bacterium]